MHTVVLSGNGGTELDTMLHAKVEPRDVPGVVAEVANRERTLYRGAVRKLDQRGAVDMPADPIFRIASMTKPATSVAVMLLKDQGSVDLDAVVGRYLPEFKGIEVIAELDESDALYATRRDTGFVKCPSPWRRRRQVCLGSMHRMVECGR